MSYSSLDGVILVKRIIAFVVACLLCMVGITATATAQPFAQILRVQVQEGEVRLTFLVGHSGEVTCLVYEANESGQQGNLLQVAQWTVEEGGVYTKSLLVPSALGYVIHLGGSDVGVPKKVSLQQFYQSGAVRIGDNETTLTLLQKAPYLTNLTVTRDDTTVTPGDVVLPGDRIQANWDGVEYTGYAVVAGDADLNGTVNARDALAVLRHSVGKITLTDAAFESANFSQSGKIDAVVALNILKFAVGKVISL